MPNGLVPGSVPRVESEVGEMMRVVDAYVRRTHQWYQDHKRPLRILFRTSGASVIVLSALIPLLSMFQGPGGRVTIAIIGTVVASLAGLSSFFRWEHSWQAYSLAQFELEFLLFRWELKIAEARNAPSEGEALEMARAATNQLIERARNAQHEETLEFFRKMLQRK